MQWWCHLGWHPCPFPLAGILEDTPVEEEAPSAAGDRSLSHDQKTINYCHSSPGTPALTRHWNASWSAECISVIHQWQQVQQNQLNLPIRRGTARRKRIEVENICCIFRRLSVKVLESLINRKLFNSSPFLLQIFAKQRKLQSYIY